MNSDMVKPEKFGHLHLVYHFTVPLKYVWTFCNIMHERVNLFYATVFSLYPLKTSKNQKFSDDFRGYRKKSVAFNGSKSTKS